MTTKLHIDLSQGIVDIEGDPELVREIYADFKIRLLDSVKSTQSAAAPILAAPIGEELISSVPKSKSKRRVAVKKKPSGDGISNGPTADAPKFDKNLDTSKLGTFYDQFAPKNNAEKILVFLKFITDFLLIESANTDQIYTCFKVVGQKIPRAFAQAFYDTSSKHGYIDFRSSADLPVTIAGENHFNHTLKRKVAE